MLYGHFKWVKVRFYFIIIIISQKHMLKYIFSNLLFVSAA